jgi:hypothetical protein
MEVYLQMNNLGNANHNIRTIEAGDESRANQQLRAGPYNWEIYTRATGETAAQIHALDGVAAYEIMKMSVRYGDDSIYGVRRIESAAHPRQPRAAELPPQTNRIFWQIVGDNGQFVSVDAADEQEAQATAHRRYGDALGNPANYEISRIES